MGYCNTKLQNVTAVEKLNQLMIELGAIDWILLGQTASVRRKLYYDKRSNPQLLLAIYPMVTIQYKAIILFLYCYYYNLFNMVRE